MLQRSTLSACVLLLGGLLSPTIALAADAVEPSQVVVVEGEPFPATFAGATAEGTLQFQSAQQPRTLAPADLVLWGQFADPAPGIHVVLNNGGLIVADSARLDGENLLGQSVSFGQWSLPVEVIAGILYRSPHDRAAADKRLDRLVSASGRDDRLLLDNGDEIKGTLTALDPMRAVLRGEEGPLEIKTDALAAIVFDPSLASRPKPAEPRMLVGLEDGSRVTATGMTTDGSNTQLTLPSGIKLTTATARIVALQSLGHRVEYLSDMAPASYRHIPYLELAWPYRDDRSVGGSQLRVGKRLYLKGLGMHSPARITYELDGEYRRFESEVALDDEAQQRGSVLFRVFVDDGSGSWQEKATSEIKRGGQPPQALSADLTGAKRISLLVDFADRGDELDHADWLNARLIR